MNKIYKYLLCLILQGSVFASFAADKQHRPTVQEYFSEVNRDFQKQKWDDLLYYSNIIYKFFPSSPFAKEALFYQGVAYFHKEDYVIANKMFSAYLKKDFSPKFFEETFKYKFEIAEKFREGSKKRLFGWKHGPKVVPAQNIALQIYNEVISSLPNHDLGARALFGKGKILTNDEEYSASLEAFQQLIRCFPKHSLAPSSFVEIGKVYLLQCHPRDQNLDLLDLANLNLQKFERAFPRDDGQKEVKENIAKMEEIYAQSFCEIGDFYYRTHKEKAAAVYYSKVIASFPNTKTSKYAHEMQNKLAKVTSQKV